MQIDPALRPTRHALPRALRLGRPAIVAATASTLAAALLLGAPARTLPVPGIGAVAAATVAPPVPPGAVPGLGGLRWGLIGNDGAHLAPQRAAGITVRLFELDWAVYEPAKGVFDQGYVTWARQRLAGLRAAGFRVILSLGVQMAPSWLLQAYPNAYYVDQYGDRYTDACSGCEVPNFVWNQALRVEQARYVARAFADFGRSFAAVRVGGGHFGELGYPAASYAGHANTYWAFDANARAMNPVPGWKPGMASPHGEATTFLNWYLGRLANCERFQIATVRRSYTGPIMLLLPSFGIRPGQAAAAATRNLAGTTSAERNGEIQRGYDFARQVAAIPDRGVVVTTTWLDAACGNDASTSAAAWSPVHYLAYLAARRGLSVYGENTGRGTASVMRFTASQARAYRLAGFLWYDEQEFLSGRWATLDDYARLIAGAG